MGLIPTGAERIIAARMKGYRPADMVLIFAGKARETANPHVVADLHIAYDWRWIRQLDACLMVNDEDDWGAMAKDLAKQRPGFLGIWNYVGNWGATIYLVPTPQDVCKPVRQWIYDLDFLPWMDFQNDDFLNGRRYGRNEHGVPYAINP